MGIDAYELDRTPNLFKLIQKQESKISRYALKDILEDQHLVSAVKAKRPRNLPSITLGDVVNSDYHTLFRTFFGHLAVKFAEYGSRTSLMECIKLLKKIALAYMTGSGESIDEECKNGPNVY